MPILQLLNESEQKKFDSCPTLSAKQREHYFTFNEEVFSYIDKMRSLRNQVGFLVQLAYFKAAGKFFSTGFKDAYLKFACNVLELAQDFTYNYKSSLRHKNYILEYSGWQSFSNENSIKLHAELTKHALQQMHPKYLLPIAAKYLINSKSELPPYYTLAELISDVYNKVGRRLINIIEQSLTDNHKSILDNLIWIEDKRKRLRH